MYEQETNTEMGEAITDCNICGRIIIPIMEGRYTDKRGETWTRICPHLLRRDSDGNIGGWFYGKGFKEI